MKSLAMILVAALMTSCMPYRSYGISHSSGSLDPLAVAATSCAALVVGAGTLFVVGVMALGPGGESYSYTFECAHCGKTIDTIRYDVERQGFSKSKDACAIVRTHSVDQERETLQQKHVAKKKSEEWGRTQVEKYAEDHVPKYAWEEEGRWYCSLTCVNAAWRARRAEAAVSFEPSAPCWRRFG